MVYMVSQPSFLFSSLEYAKIQILLLPGSCSKVCGGGWWVLKPILVFSFDQAEQYLIPHPIAIIIIV
jgi:hypothetical protein